MSDGSILYEETAAYIDLIATKIEERRGELESNELLTEKLETCWSKVQCLIEKESHNEDKNSGRICALKEVQYTLKILSKKNLSSARTDKNSTDPERVLSIEQTILKPGKVSFDQIAGLDEAKTLLREAIVLPMQYPHLFVGKRKPWRSILLYGPPGTGKSRMAQAVSSEIKSTFYSVSSSDLLSSWFGESEKLIKELFEHARQRSSRAIIFIDEIDSLCRKRDSREAETTRRVKTELLKQMEGVNGQEDDIFFLCATNCPWELDKAFLRRFEKRIYITLPQREARRHLFDIHFSGVDVNLNDVEMKQLLDLTEGYSGSDLATCISDATLQPIRDLSKSTHWLWSEDKSTLCPCSEAEPDAIPLRLHNIPNEKVRPRPVTSNDIFRSLDANRRTISAEELQRYDEFTKAYGQIG